VGKSNKLSTGQGSAVPITNFSNCHVVIISNLMNFSSLPTLLASPEQARQVAKQTLAFFRNVIYLHHTEEELDLFPAALACAVPGEELEWVKSSVERLTREHRQVESSWLRMENEVEKIAHGVAGDLDASALEALVLDYGAHAAFEEKEFLPLCRSMLNRGNGANQMTALDLSLQLQLPPLLAEV
jgi:hemerythrin-like domain-containing protein